MTQRETHSDELMAFERWSKSGPDALRDVMSVLQDESPPSLPNDRLLNIAVGLGVSAVASSSAAAASAATSAVSGSAAVAAGGSMSTAGSVATAGASSTSVAPAAILSTGLFSVKGVGVALSAVLTVGGIGYGATTWVQQHRVPSSPKADVLPSKYKRADETVHRANMRDFSVDVSELTRREDQSSAVSTKPEATYRRPVVVTGTKRGTKRAPLLDPAMEVSLLTAAQKNLDADPGKALRLISKHRRFFATSSFAQERERLTIEALVNQGRMKQAKRSAVRFFSRWPASAHRPGLERLLASTAE